ncbi:MAG: Holliday junction branch migration DNA helicase RuvB [Legionellales bacterium]|nr:Holliday junction branch migration DNA helicase RuvB [Legionellales bacterium]
MEDNSIVETTIHEVIQDKNCHFDTNLRPKKLSDYIGQSEIISQLQVFTQAAMLRQESLDHVLIYGPPGLGKTTLSHIIANEMNSELKITSGPSLDKAGDLAGILTNLQPNDVLFIDEIHRLPTIVEETLYAAMEDFKIDIIIGEGSASRSITLDLPKFTLVGATTRAGLLTSPLRDRFGIGFRLEFYTTDELSEIIKRSSTILGIDIDAKSTLNLAMRSRGTPRIANRLLKRIRDFSQIKGDDCIHYDTCQYALSLLNIDSLGLDQMDQKYLETLINKFSSGPVGLETLSMALSETKDTIEDIIEPFLIQQGLIERSPRGRVACAKARNHLLIN